MRVAALAASAAAAATLLANGGASVVAAAETYVPLEGCAVVEGETLAGPFKGCDAKCCQAKCDAEPRCNSISLFSVAKVCYLKDRCVSPDDPVKINKYTTWYKACGDAVLDSTQADPRFRPAITATADSPVPDILKQLHAWSVTELYTDKFKSKSGALMGSKIVKEQMESPESTRCSNEGWLESEARLDLDFDAVFPPPDADVCEAGKVYHILNSGIGSWVSNLANVMYTHAIKPADDPQKTIAFRDQNSRPQQRWSLLFEHEIPLCKTFKGKSTPFVRPNTIERLKLKSVCDYAAAKAFFTRKLWEVLSRGTLASKLDAAVAEHTAAIHQAAVGDGGDASKFSGSYIGVHLRHKWEFKLQPPKLVDVATLIEAVSNQINPLEHTDAAHADPTCFTDNAHKASVWGPAKTVVFCASDELEACQVLQQLLDADKFYVHAIPMLKINSGVEGVLSYLLDVSMLKNAGVFIGTGSSNLSRMVNALRGPTKLSITTDIDWNTVHF